MALSLFLLPVVGLILGLPVFLVLILGALATLAFFLNMPMTTVHQVIYGSISSYTLLAIPFFIFAGEVMGRGGISRRIIDWVLALVGRTSGAVGLVTVGTSSIYGAISGSSPATVASVGRQLYPEMRRNGYSAPFSLGLINAGGAISIVIPPSINFILYGAVAEQSIVSLFTAGIIPGLLLSGTLAIVVLAYAWRNNIREGQAFSFERLVIATRRAFWSLLTPIIVLGAIYGGIVSPTEAGGIACVYALLVTTVIHRDLRVRQVISIAGDAALLTAQIMIIVAAAGVFAWILTTTGFQTALVAYVSALDVQPWMVLLAINLLLLIVGCFIDPTSAVLTLTPLLLPVALHLGVDPIHFGVVMTVNLSIGMYTPPFGLNLFVTQAVLKTTTRELYRGVLPFIAIQIITLLVITFVPSLSLAFLR
jgi:C4-dicarboxylate transporter, DctM subunit